MAVPDWNAQIDQAYATMLDRPDGPIDDPTGQTGRQYWQGSITDSYNRYKNVQGLSNTAARNKAISDFRANIGRHVGVDSGTRGIGKTNVADASGGYTYGDTPAINTDVIDMRGATYEFADGSTMTGIPAHYEKVQEAFYNSLGRAPGTQGMVYWSNDIQANIDRLIDSGMSEEAALTEATGRLYGAIASSPEFHNLAYADEGVDDTEYDIDQIGVNPQYPNPYGYGTPMQPFIIGGGMGGGDTTIVTQANRSPTAGDKNNQQLKIAPKVVQGGNRPQFYNKQQAKGGNTAGGAGGLGIPGRTY